MSVLAIAQERVEQSKHLSADLQTVNDGFFDPTKADAKAAEQYTFHVDYRLEVGYAQNNQRTRNKTFPDMLSHGIRLGAEVDFCLPLHFSIQTGVLYSLTYGVNTQHWRSQDARTVQEEYIKHRILEHNLTIPVRATYTIPLWRELNLFFYTGPQLQIGLAQTDYPKLHLSDNTRAWAQEVGLHTSQYDRYQDKELFRTNIQYGLGGGLEWDRYRLQAGYDFGLNNLVRQRKITDQHMWEWSWYVSFLYRL